VATPSSPAVRVSKALVRKLTELRLAASVTPEATSCERWAAVRVKLCEMFRRSRTSIR
jgi:hypothetical protein